MLWLESDAGVRNKIRAALKIESCNNFFKAPATKRYNGNRDEGVLLIYLSRVHLENVTIGFSVISEQ